MKSMRHILMHAFYHMKTPQQVEVNCFNALSIGSGVVKSTPAFSIGLVDNQNFHLSGIQYNFSEHSDHRLIVYQRFEWQMRIGLHICVHKTGGRNEGF